METYMKIYYHSALRVQVLELMCLTHFLPRAYDVMIGDVYKRIRTQGRLVQTFQNYQDKFTNKKSNLMNELELVELERLDHDLASKPSSSKLSKQIQI